MTCEDAGARRRRRSATHNTHRRVVVVVDLGPTPPSFRSPGPSTNRFKVATRSGRGLGRSLTLWGVHPFLGRHTHTRPLFHHHYISLLYARDGQAGQYISHGQHGRFGSPSDRLGVNDSRSPRARAPPVRSSSLNLSPGHTRTERISSSFFRIQFFIAPGLLVPVAETIHRSAGTPPY